MASSVASLVAPTINNEVTSENNFVVDFFDDYYRDDQKKVFEVDCLGCLEDGGDGTLVLFPFSHSGYTARRNERANYK